MEIKNSDSNLKAILNSPSKFIPAVPTPDWSNNATNSTNVSTSSNSLVIINLNIIKVFSIMAKTKLET